MTSFTVVRSVNLPVEKVWEVLGTFTTSPGPEIKVEVIEYGDQTNNNVGTVRNLTVGMFSVQERLESANPPTGLTFSILKGTPTRVYKGEVQFEKNGEASTTIRFVADIKPIIPFTGFIIIKIAKSIINKIIDSLIKNHIS